MCSWLSSPFQSHLRDCSHRGTVNGWRQNWNSPWPCYFTKSKYPKPWNTTSGGPSLLFCHGDQRTNFPILELLSSHCQHFQFHLPLTKCSFLFLRKEAERAFWRPHRQSQKASWAANNSEQTTIWWVKCKRIRDIWITFLGKYTWVCNVKQGYGVGGEWRRECLEKCCLCLANCKMFETNNLRCFAQPRVWLDSPFLLFMCHFQAWHLNQCWSGSWIDFLKIQLFKNIIACDFCVSFECEVWGGVGEELGI